MSAKRRNTMLQIRKIAVLVTLATLVALAAAPTGAKAFVSVPTANAPGPFSETISCGPDDGTILNLGVRTFNLTDVTIANADTSPHTVGIFNNSYGGVQYTVGAGATVTQKFETPIRFAGAVNSPYLWCDSYTSSVQVSVQGTIQ
jgi:hypothetical protein